MRWRALGGLGVWWLVALVVGGGLTAVVLGHVEVGGSVMALGVLLAAGLRLVLPPPRGGGLEVRSKALDVVMLVGLAAVVLVAFSLVKLTPR